MNKPNKKLLSMFIAATMIFNNISSIVVNAESSIAENQELETQEVQETQEIQQAQEIQETQENAHENTEQTAEENNSSQEQAPTEQEQEVSNEQEETEKKSEDLNENKSQEDKKVQENQVNPLNQELENMNQMLNMGTYAPLSYNTLSEESKISYGLRIQDVAIGTAGEGDFTRETLAITLENDTERKLFDITRYDIARIIVDDLEVPIVDERYGHRTFVLTNNLYQTFNDSGYVSGTKAIEDFKLRDEHKVIIVFRDGSFIQYKDDNYIVPAGRQEIVPNVSQEEEESTTGIANEYTIKRVMVVDKWGVKEVAIEFDKEISRAHSNEIQSVRVNGTLFTNTPGINIFSRHWSGQIRASDEGALTAAESKSPIEVEVTFSDGSKTRNYTPSNSIPVPEPQKDHLAARKVNGYLITKDKLKTSILNQAFVKEVAINPTDRTISIFNAHELTFSFNPININGTNTKVSKVSYYAMGNLKEAKKVEGQESTFKFDIPHIAIYPETSTNDLDLEIVVELENAIEGYKNPTDKIILKLDYNKDFSAPEVENISGGEVLPDIKIANNYQVTDILFKEKAGEIPERMVVKFDKAIAENHIQEIESIKINGIKYEQNSRFAIKAEADGGIYVFASEMLSKAKEKTPLEIEILFKDKSKLNFSKEIELPKTNIGAEYKVTETKIVAGWVRDKFVINFDKEITNEHANKIDSIKINGEVFEKDIYYIFKDRDGGISTDSANVVNKIKAIKDEEALEIEVLFKDGSKISYLRAAKLGIAQQHAYDISSVEVAKDNSQDNVKITFNKNLENLHAENIKSIIVNETVFEKDVVSPTWSENYKVLKSSNVDFIAKIKEKANADITVIFSDDSKFSKNIAVIRNDELNLNSNLENGEYTLTFKSYVKNTNLTELSTLNHYFDVRAKLVVEDGKKTISVLNHKHSDLILDFAIETNGAYKRFDKKVLSTNNDGTPKHVEYSVEIDSLSGIKNAAVLGRGPMGGNPGEIGSYDSSNYKKLDIVFDNKVTKNWTKYKVVEDEETKKSKNDEILIKALIANGLDTNGDQQISKEELMNAEGGRKKVSIKIDHFPMTNVLDLEGLELTDISMLRDLGPNIKGINLNANKIETLPDDVFQNATGVTHIILCANNIRSVGANTFKNMPKLKYIDFDGNNLGTLPQGVFDNNLNLTNLALNNTALTSVPDDLIKKNTKLEYFYLYENKIKRLPDDFFSENDRLREVLIWRNELETLPSSLGVNKSRLIKIWAQNNNISSIPDTFSDIKLISEIDLSDNRISKVSNEFFVSLIKHSKHRDITLDLRSNYITRLPIDEMLNALDNGKKIKNLKVNMNYLPKDISEAEKEKLKQVGVYFDVSGGQDVYYPQKGSISPSATAKDGKISLEQQFDILELFYWDMGDSTYYGGQNIFNTDKEFLEYLLGEGRDFNKVKRSIPRDEAIKEIFTRKNMTWKVETTITKNGGQAVYYHMSDENQKEGQNQTFNDNSMSSGDRYTLTKALHVNHLGWHRVLEYSVDFTAGETKAEEKAQEVKVKLYRENTNDLSVANKTLRPTAILNKENGKFRYTLFFKPMEVSGIVGEISKFSIKVNDNFVAVEAKNEAGEYPKSYTFELEEKAEKLNVMFEVKGMPVAQRADLVFEYSDKEETQYEIVKGHILTADGKSISKADQILDKKITFKKIDKKAGPFNLVEFTVKFNEMKMGDIISGVESFAIKLKDTWMYAKAVEGQKGVFTFEMLESAIKEKDSLKDTIFAIKFKTYPEVKGHETEREAKLLLDWNGYFNGVIEIPAPKPEEPKPPIDTPEVKDGEYEVEVSINQADSNSKSVSDKALVRTAKVEKKDNEYKYTLTFKPMEVFGIKGNITKFSIMKNGEKVNVPLEQNGENKAAVFTLSEATEKLRIFVHADVMEEMGMGEQRADLIISWKGNKPSTPEVPPTQDKKETVEITTKEEKISENKVVTKVEVKEQDIVTAIQKIENHNSNSSIKKDTLQIEVEKSSNVEVKNQEVKVSLQKEVLKKISEKEGIKVELKMPMSNVTIPSKVVEQLYKESDSNIEFSIKNIENTSIIGLSEADKNKIGNRGTIEVEIKKQNGEKITHFVGTLEIEIPYERKDSEKPSRIKVYYIQENTLTAMPTRYDDYKKAVIFTTNHFSKYAIGYEEEKEPSRVGGGGGGGGGSSAKELSDGTHIVDIWLKKAGTDEVSMANKAMSNKARVVKEGKTYTYTIRFMPMQLGKIEGKVTRFFVRGNEVYGNDGEYTFELNEKVDKLDVAFNVDAMGDVRQNAQIIFDWYGTNPMPVQSVKIEKDMQVKAVQVQDETKESLINEVINSKAKMIQENGQYQYIVEFKKLDRDNKTFELSSLGVYTNPNETKIITPTDINEGEYTKSYILIFDEKKDKIKISFKYDNLNIQEKEAYLIFEEAKQDKKEIKADQIKQKAEKILTKAEEKYYSKQTLQEIRKVLEAYNKGDEKAKQELEKLVEKARIEKITSKLQEGYMTGYDGGIFKPNKDISIAEAAVMFADLIEEDEEIKQNETKQDETNKKWYSQALNKMIRLGYIIQKEGEKIDPNRAITRGEYAYIVGKLRNYEKSEKTLKDIPKDYWAKDEISSLVQKGVINGYKDGTFKAENTITRAEAVTIVSRAFPTKVDISKKAKFNDVSEKHWAYNAIMSASKNNK